MLFSRSVVSDSLQPHGLQHARLLCPSLSLGACSNAYPLSQWWHPTISSSFIPVSSCLQSFPESGFFSSESALPIRWPNYWSFSFSISPSSEFKVDFFRIDWLDLLAVQGTLKGLLQHHSSRASTFLRSAFFMVQWAQAFFTPAESQPPGTPFAEHPVKCQLSQRSGEHQDLSYNSMPGTQCLALPDFLPGKKAPRT